jgi:phosphoribosyl-ATP pyrophosphohydrolase
MSIKMQSEYDAILYRLWQATQTFHHRFRGSAPSMISAFDAMDEEYNEFINAVYYGDNASLQEEAADLMVTIIGVLLSQGVTYGEFSDMINAVIAKNLRKTHETHWVDPDTGRITRRD